ncbi:hypothetical protein LIER_37515 [Lithospermum erythrorhizon]|uniref:Retrovirus-related Pol polyprotein from transposon TNT 1-94 n=1 Tax=Lithospermum erythrorhizon TaxID=34254 RepID=A0AAV3PQS9_LITER
MDDCNLVCNPISPGAKVNKDANGKAVDDTLFKEIVGSLMYLTTTRPNLMYMTSLIRRYKTYKMHMQVTKRALSDYVGDNDDRRSTSGYVFLHSAGGVAWSSKKQPIVTLSTTEAEYVAAAFYTCRALWMKGILEEIRYRKLQCINIKDLSKERKVVLEHCGTEDQVADIMTKPLKLEIFLKLTNMLGMKEITEVN